MPDLMWPVDNPYITQRFGERGTSWYGVRGHLGLDFGDNEGNKRKDGVADTIYAAGSGRKSIHENKSFGLHVIIDHGNGWKTIYAHMLIVYDTGQPVSFGQKLGKMGNTGLSTATHLHFQLTRWGVAINPEKYLTITRMEFEQRLARLEKASNNISNPFAGVRQVKGSGEIIIAPEFKDSNLDALTLGILARVNGQPLLRKVDADNLKKNNWFKFRDPYLTKERADKRYLRK